MKNSAKSNRLQHETSPYLLQHAQNPVDWYPWCEEAFERAKDEDKPIFLSIGYSTCHWCHVMAHESFEDEEIAELLNKYYICIKVDKEERPDIDSIYMSVCQAFTGSGGWPTSIFMTAEQRPFFAGTYYPKHSRGGMIGMRELLNVLHEKWETDREELLERADVVMLHLAKEQHRGTKDKNQLPDKAVRMYQRAFDRINGGFGGAPKFPAPHNLLFLLSFYEKYHDESCLNMAEHTLMQMYRGGIFDHVGGGFSRYSTDEYFLVPHFEKMLYDNALLMLAYCRTHALTKDKGRAELYLDAAKRTADYVLREMTSPDGGFYSAQDADSEGEEGKYYVFSPDEIERVLGKKEALAFCAYYDITHEGNFEGRSIPNLLGSDPFIRPFEGYLPRLLEYRANRHSLHTDKKILTSWNSLMIAAMCALYMESGLEKYLAAAKKAQCYIEHKMREGEGLFVSFAGDKRGARGFLDDYGAYCFARLWMYRATLDNEHLEAAKYICAKAIADFEDNERGGFYFSGADNEKLILRPKETYDGAMPSGNSLMAWNLVKLWNITGSVEYRDAAEKQLDFMAGAAADYPIGYSMFLMALMEMTDPHMKVTVIPAGHEDKRKIADTFTAQADIILLPTSEQYPIKDGKTTFYICAGHKCFPPTCDPGDMLKEINI